MREIKFRAWKKTTKEMVYNFALGANGCIHFSDNDFLGPKFFVLMQYTGLKDKNGKGSEVYGDDVIELSGVHYHVFWNSKRGQWYTVIINKGVKGKHYKPLWEILENSFSKIIGNIHEELLKDEN